jgi:hypothetical protein
MLDRFFYIWSIIPVSLFLLGVWGFVKSKTGRKQKEPVTFYFKQAVFCFFILCLSVPFIHSGLLQKMYSYLDWLLPEDYLQWLVYPALLLIGAKIFPGEKPPRDKRLR